MLTLVMGLEFCIHLVEHFLASFMGLILFCCHILKKPHDSKSFPAQVMSYKMKQMSSSLGLEVVLLH